MSITTVTCPHCGTQITGPNVDQLVTCVCGKYLAYRPGTTHVMMIIDASGSMNPLASDVRGSFNGYLDGLATDQPIRVSASLFNAMIKSHATAEHPAVVQRLDVLNYSPNGVTALLDAVGLTVTRFRDAVRLGPEDKVLVVIHTDGLENASKEYTWQQVNDLIRELTATKRWEFIYVGAGPDAWGQSERFARMGTQTVNTRASGQSMAANYNVFHAYTTDYAEGKVGVRDIADAMDKAEGETSS